MISSTFSPSPHPQLNDAKSRNDFSEPSSNERSESRPMNDESLLDRSVTEQRFLSNGKNTICAAEVRFLQRWENSSVQLGAFSLVIAGKNSTDRPRVIPVVPDMLNVHLAAFLCIGSN